MLDVTAARVWFAAFGLVLTIAGLSTSAAVADLGDCSQPTSSGATPITSDCLFILRAAVGSSSCITECVCAPGGSLPITATDALVCLKKAVGQSVELACPCPPPSTQTTAPPTTTTQTTTTTAPPTTMPVPTTTLPTTTTTLPSPDWGLPCFASKDCGPALCADPTTTCQCDAFLDSIAVPGSEAMCFFDCMDSDKMLVTSCRMDCLGPTSAPPCDTTTAGDGGFTGVVTGAGKCEPTGFATSSVEPGGPGSELKRLLIDFEEPIDESSLFASAPPDCDPDCPTPAAACDSSAGVAPLADRFRLQIGEASPPPDVCAREGVSVRVCKYSATGYAFLIDAPICTPLPLDFTLFLSCHVESAGTPGKLLHFSTGDFFASFSWPP